MSTPPTANIPSSSTPGLDLQADRVIPRKQVISWALWDWATQPYNTIILTFVFTALYLTSDSFIAPELAALPEDDTTRVLAIDALSGQFGLALFLAGLAIAILAPVMG
jgi:UMF1 family MFS transporter